MADKDITTGLTKTTSLTTGDYMYAVDGGNSRGILFEDVVDSTKVLGKIYSKGNILGTVSQTEGVPTGEIIERGSNANGEYVRFADGTQICTHTDTSSSSGNSTWTYPVSFAAGKTDALLATPTTLTGVNVPSIVPATTSSATWVVRDALSAGARVAVLTNLMAIGRWF